jgi:hypothetical protein
MSPEPEVGYLLDVLRQKSDKIDDLVEKEIRTLWREGVERISNPNIRQAIKFFYIHVVPVEFFSAPSSMTGNHHPEWHNDVPGGFGILRHIIECCVMADKELEIEGYVKRDLDDRERIDPDALDIVLAATLVTDTFKNGSWGKRTLRNHGEIAARMWRLTTTGRVDEWIGSKIADAVHFHYGRYTPVPEGSPPVKLENLPKLTQIVHRLDARSADGNNMLIYRPVGNIPPRESIRP